MKKKTLIITNPGEVGDEEYCQGVNVDRESYRLFLDSAIGGWWYKSEIEVLDRPDAVQVRRAVFDLSNLDYSLIIFSGHGYYSQTLETTVLALRPGQTLPASELQVRGQKQTLILDCCRKVMREEEFREELLKAEKAFRPQNGAKCREYYERQIESCSISTVVMFSCDVNQSAYDTARGGIYSYNLIRGARTWAADYSARSGPAVLSVAGAHEIAKAAVALSGQNQTPVINKLRSGPYFPFSVVAG